MAPPEFPRIETDPGTPVGHGPGCCPRCEALLDAARGRIRRLETAVAAEKQYGKALANRVLLIEAWKDDQRIARAKSEGRDEVQADPERWGLSKKVATGAALFGSGAGVSQLIEWLVTNWPKGG